MKHKCISLILIVVSLNFYAQNIKIGTKAGLNLNNKPSIDIANTPLSTIFSEVKDQSIGFHIGVFARIELASFFIQPEIYGVTFKTNYAVQNEEFDIKQKRIDIPILIGKKFIQLIRIQGGPVFSYYLNDKISLADVQNIKQDNFTVGLQGGAGIDLSKITIDIRYEVGLTDKVTDFVKNNYNFQVDHRPNQFMISLGYVF